LRKLMLVHLQRRGKGGGDNWFAGYDPGDNLAAEFEVFLSTARELEEAFGNGFK